MRQQARADNHELTALEYFVYHNEPSGMVGGYWRIYLAKALEEVLSDK